MYEACNGINLASIGRGPLAPPSTVEPWQFRRVSTRSIYSWCL